MSDSATVEPPGSGASRLTSRLSAENREAVHAAITPLLVAKFLSLLSFALAVWLKLPLSALPAWQSLHDGMLAWDASSYVSIAQSGYPTCIACHQAFLDAFLPGFPILLHVVTLVARDEVIAAQLIDLVAEAVALVFVYRLILHERDQRAAGFAVWAFALGPFAFFLSAVYTEASFMAAAAAALYYARTGRSSRAVLAAFIASALRLNGLVLAPVLLIEYLRHRPWREVGTGEFLLAWGSVPIVVVALLAVGARTSGVAAAIAQPWVMAALIAVGAGALYLALRDVGKHAGDTSTKLRFPSLDWHFFELALAPLPLLLYFIYLRFHTGDFNALFDVNQSGFGHSFAPFWDGFKVTWDTWVTATDLRLYWFGEIAFGVGGAVLCLIAWLWPRFPKSLALYCTLIWLMATSISFWRSVPRYELAMFPVVLIVIDLTARVRFARPVVLAVSGYVMCWAAFIYGTGEFLG